MGYERRKSPKIKVKRKDDDIVVEKIEMKKRKSPARKNASKTNKTEKNVKTDKPAKDTSLHILKGGLWNGKNKKRSSFITACVAGVIIISIIVMQLVTPTGIVEWSQNLFSTWGSGGGLPIAISGDNVRDMVSRSDSIFVVTDSHMYAFNSSGKQITSVQHGYSEPVFDISAARTLIYDRGSYGLRVDALYTNIINTQLNEEIITADICNKGYVAVATQSTDYTAQVTVYDKSFESVFRWSSPDGYVSCVEMSNNGKYLAVCTVTGKNGDYCSNVNIFNVSNGHRILNKQILGTMYVSASSNSKTLTLSGTDSVICLKWDGSDVSSYEYYNLELVNMDYNSRNVFVYHPDGDERQYEVCVLDKNGKGLASFSVTGSVSKICADKKYVYAYNNGVVHKYNYEGQLQNDFSVGFEYVFISPFKNKAVIASDMKLSYIK